tara:strand:- start:74 stop:400 length:327 start_codon:yes stop_codon:yes gene_type:complete
MTITFKHEQGYELGRINSKSNPDDIKANAKSWRKKSGAIWVSCSDKPHLIQDAKSKLIKLSTKEKFEQTEPTEVESKFEGQVSFVMNRVPLTSVEDNTDWAVEMLMGN